MKSGDPSPPTIEYVPARLMMFRLAKKIGIAGLVFLPSFVFGFFVMYAFFPRKEVEYVRVENKLEVESYKKKLEKSEKDYQLLAERFEKFGKEKDREWEQRINFMLQEDVLGVLIMKDMEAQTVTNKQAATANKKGFHALKKDLSHPVQSYFVYKEKGYGLAGDLKSGLFIVLWEPGLVKVPPLNPGYLRFQGIKASLGKK